MADACCRRYQQESAGGAGQVNKSLHSLLRDAVPKGGNSPTSAANETPSSATGSVSVVNGRQVVPAHPLAASAESIQFIPERSNRDEAHSPKWSPMREKPHGVVPAGPAQRCARASQQCMKQPCHGVPVQEYTLFHPDDEQNESFDA